MTRKYNVSLPDETALAIEKRADELGLRHATYLRAVALASIERDESSRDDDAYFVLRSLLHAHRQWGDGSCDCGARPQMLVGHAGHVANVLLDAGLRLDPARREKTRG